MHEPLHQSSDVPNFDTYPDTPPVNEGERLLEKGRSPLEQRAAELGTVAGKVVSMVRQVRGSVENLPEHPMVERISDLAGAARERVGNLRSAAVENAQHVAHVTRDKTAELGRQVRDRTVDLGRQAKFGYYRARLRANQTVREYPVQVALVAGLVGFLIGIGLRIRRANRAY